MNEFLKVFLNIRSLRAACRELTLEQLQEGLEKLTGIIEERQQDEASERAAREEHQRKLQEYSDMLKAAGIDPNELVATVSAPSKAKSSKRAPRPAKYRYMDNGQEKTWTGQGRMPSAIAKAVNEEGKSLEDFAI
ncbi:H-NS family histone-like protein [Aeromonas simiae]|uniref:H-NS family histone-like protein n=1 Tax=Aeromonas simiae TaxID=218936 RepID=UPI0005A64C1D|nr:H-NS family nucleoid-associated regulatory protein [Aeromonas simiae]MDO2948027.1 H-NS histone family protein [Aeromonas simiae]MDO2952278.1 H-NS histone family protein [Aeromonas simiae]MDO2955410.1 H-NS histone family protein [Aeromonas simiae]